MNNKLIIFGAGDYGKLALEHYNKERVAYFADNNPERVGKLYFGKEILSFEKYLEIANQYQTVIAVKGYESIARQLKEHGIKEFSVFSLPYKAAVEKLGKCGQQLKGKLVFFGVDDCIDILLNDCRKNGVDLKNIDIAETDGSQLIGQNIEGYKVRNIKTVLPQADVIIISSINRAYALQTYAQSLKKEGMTIINPFVQSKYYETKEAVYNPYEAEKDIVTEEDWNNFNKRNQFIDAIENQVNELSKHQLLFDHVEIETINRCNGGCSFCPVNVKNDIREKKIMDEQLFINIIDQLAALDYSGRLATFSNNEPFLDERIIRFNEYARKKLPAARLHLFTNGTLLTLEKFVQIIEYLDELIIDNYNQELELNKNSKIIKEYCDEHVELKEKVTIVLRKQQEILTSRGGDAPNRKDIPSYPDAKCVLPFKQLIIRPDGKASLCCNDPYGKYTLGDLTKQSILEVWNGKEFQEIRSSLLKGRKAVEHCRQCDTFILC